MRRSLIILLFLVPLFASRADALNVRDVIELSKANVGDQILLALIDVEQSVFTLDTASLKQLKEAGVSEQVIIAMIRSGRAQPASSAQQAAQPADATEPAPQPEDPPAPQAQVVVNDHHDAAPAPVYIPIAVPMYLPTQAFGTFGTIRTEHVTHDVVTDGGGLVRVREALPPNCTQAQPIFWGNGGKQRKGTFAPPVEIICR